MIARSKRGVSNFGDELSRFLVSELTGQRVLWSPLASAEVVSVGSVLNSYAAVESSAIVLGSGIRDPRGLETHGFQATRVLSVRGTLTRDHIGLGASTVLGDPGILISHFVERSPKRGTTNVLIPHFGVFNTSAGRKSIERARIAGFKIVYPNLAPLEMAGVIAEAHYVATSSLHAYIFANALGIPAQLISFADGVHSEPGFKYRDYLSIFGLEPQVASLNALVHDKKSLVRSQLSSEYVADFVIQRIPATADSLASLYSKV